MSPETPTTTEPEPAPPPAAKSNGEGKTPAKPKEAKPKEAKPKEAKPKEAKPKEAKPKEAKPKAAKVASQYSDGDMIIVPLSQIVVREGQNPRREIKLTESDGFVQHIKTFGLMHPIGVAPREEDDKFDLIYGERRFRAMQLLRMKETRAIVNLGRSREEQYMMRFAENFHRLDLTPVEEAVTFQNYITASGKSGKDVAEFFKVSPAQVSQRLKILKMAPELQLALNKGDINFTQARELARLDPKEQLQTLTQIVKGETTRAVDITHKVEKKRRDARDAKAKDDGKKRGRPALTKENAPNIAQQNLENAIEALNNFAIEAKPKTELRTGLITLYERFSNSRSESKKEQMRGAIKVLEWALGIRDEF
jgi:ParB/RepB/Spo0J family partition protein